MVHSLMLTTFTDSCCSKILYTIHVYIYEAGNNLADKLCLSFNHQQTHEGRDVTLFYVLCLVLICNRVGQNLAFRLQGQFLH